MMPNDVFSHIRVANTVYDVKDETARSGVNTLSEDVTTLQTDLGLLDDRVDDTESDIDALQNDVGGLDDRITALEQGGGSGWSITYASASEKLTITAS